MNYDNIKHLVNLLQKYDTEGYTLDGVPVKFDNDFYAFYAEDIHFGENCWYVDTLCLSCILINNNTNLVSPLMGDDDGFIHVEWLADYLGLHGHAHILTGFDHYYHLCQYLKGLLGFRADKLRTSKMVHELRNFLKNILQGGEPGRRFDPTSYDMVGNSYGRIMADGEWEYPEGKPYVSSDLAGWVVRYFDNVPDTQPLIEADDDTGEADYYQYYYRAAELLGVPLLHILEVTDLAVLQENPTEATLTMLHHVSMGRTFPEAMELAYNVK